MLGKITTRLAIVGSVALTPVMVAATPASATALVVHPGQSIQAAVDAAQPGATVVVTRGTYHEAVCVTTDHIKLRGEGAVIRPPAQPPQTPCAEFGGQGIGILLLGVVDFESGQVVDPITDVKVSGFRVEGFAEFGIGMLGGRDVDIVANTAVDNEEYGIARFVSTGGSMKDNRATGSDEAGLYLGDSPDANATIAGNVAWNNGFFGIFVRDSSHGTVVGNTSFGNCIGIIVLSGHGPVVDWTVKGNQVRDNTRACPESEEGPPASGVGIALAGASHSTVMDNVLVGNRPAGPSIASGGVVVFDTTGLGGGEPVGNLVKGNLFSGNEPDLFYDGSGSGNRFIANSCQTSIPDGLC
jgi:parallel beta-helix repeat protein